MSRPRILRLLRIAVSAVCGILCLLLISLWVRSYGNRELLFTAPGVVCLSTQGVIMTIRMPVYEDEVGLAISPSEGRPIEPSDSNLGFYAHAWSPSFWIIQLPHWLSVLLAAGLAAAPWIHRSRRFSLRTLLLATTLAAVVLRLVVAMR
jgi:hypothetical protein